MPDALQIPADQLIEVPPQFLPAFLTAVSDWIVDLAMRLEGSVCGETRQPWRASEDELCKSMSMALDDRYAIANALDDGTPVPVDAVRMHLSDAIAALHLELSQALELDDDRAVAVREEQLRHDLFAWSASRGLEVAGRWPRENDRGEES